MQCAGAAIFRQKIGVADRLPDALLKIKEDDSNVFATLHEFIAHHEPTLDPLMVNRMAALAASGYYTKLEVVRARMMGKA